MAEIKFYSDDRKLKGKAFSSGKAQKESVEYINDNNILTSFIIKDPISDWAGLDFGEPINITSFAICSYTDDNEIMLGEEYELKYWNNGWKSLGLKTADSYTLEWQALSGALLWLRNLTKGVEERIFTYENDNQIWW